MSDVDPHPAVAEVLAQLREALGSVGQREAMIAEVRADLAAQIEALQAQGMSEDEAVAEALEALGNPYELAHHAQAVAAPLPGRALTVLRWIGVTGVILWTLLFIWAMRPGVYGQSGIAVNAGVLMFHLPIILVLWPGIIWRRNWLFGLVPGVIGLLLMVAMSIGGVSGQSEIRIQLDGSGQLVAGEIPESMQAFDWLLAARIAFFCGFGAACIILYLMMQQRTRRRRFLGILLLVFLLVELPFQSEKWRFRQVRDQALAAATDSPIKSLPEDDIHLRPNPDDAGYSLYWPRPIRRSHSISYNSADGRIWVND